MEFGKSLRAAREARGYTISQIAETTHIKFAIVEGLENDDFSPIVAPIYGRGFVKLYCEAVGLDAKPFVDEFMEIVNGNREIPIRERTPAPAAEPATPEHSPAAETPPPPPEPVAEPAAPETPPPPAEHDLFSQETPKADISRYASPFRPEGRPPAAFPVLPWRLIVLGAAGLALLVILVFGVRALYRATSGAPEAPETESVSQKTPAAAQPADKTTARTRQQDIPPLYFD